MLGRVHEIDGEIIHGQAKGRTIGFPTANLAASNVLLPRDGVYAVVGRVLGEEGPLLTGVANLGVRPTLGAGRSVEVHLFDTQRDLYGKTLRVGFVERLRDEQKFDGLSALVAQIDVDAKRARGIASAYAEAAPGALR
jgi:riboflavin kinase/FMN adenylyltransferase